MTKEDIRILFLGVTVPGSTWLLRGQAEWFRRQGYEVHLLAPCGPEVVQFCADEGCVHHPVVISRRIDPLQDLITLVNLVRIFWRHRPDIVNTGTPKMGLLGTIAARVTGVARCIYTCRGLRYEHETGMLRMLLMGTEWVAGQFAHSVVCIAPSVRDRAVAEGVFPARKTKVIAQGSSNGISLERFAREQVNVNARSELLDRFDLRHRFVFGFVGRLIDRKGINELVAAFDRLHAENPNVRLLLVGADDRSQLSDPSVLERIERHPAIKRTGVFRDVTTALSLMDVFVLPAWWEGFGNAYLEAAAMGLPIVGSQGTGCRDAVCHNFNGVCVTIKDTDAVYHAMKAYLQDPELRTKHGSNGPAWAKHFRPEIIWQGLHELYNEQRASPAR
jgi:glycosyltransferase involved in cell wall biosynthesis